MEEAAHNHQRTADMEAHPKVATLVVVAILRSVRQVLTERWQAAAARLHPAQPSLAARLCAARRSHPSFEDNLRISSASASFREVCCGCGSASCCRRACRGCRRAYSNYVVCLDRGLGFHLACSDFACGFCFAHSSRGRHDGHRACRFPRLIGLPHEHRRFDRHRACARRRASLARRARGPRVCGRHLESDALALPSLRQRPSS